MLSFFASGGFGLAATPTPQDLEGTALVLTQLEAAEQSLRATYDNLMSLGLSSGMWWVEAVNRYNAAVMRYVNLAKPIIDGMNDEAEASGQPRQPLRLPNCIDIQGGSPACWQIKAAAGLSGFGEDTFVDSSKVQITPLGDFAGGGIKRVIILGVVIALTGVALAVAWKYLVAPGIVTIIDSIKGTKQMQIEADAQRDATDKAKTLALSCIAKAKTAAEAQKCMADAAKAVETAAKVAPTAPWGFAHYLALFGALGIVGVAGYVVVDRVRAKRARERFDVAAEAAPTAMMGSRHLWR